MKKHVEGGGEENKENACNLRHLLGLELRLLQDQAHLKLLFGLVLSGPSLEFGSGPNPHLSIDPHSLLSPCGHVCRANHR